MAFLHRLVPADPAGDAAFWPAFFDKAAQEHQLPLRLPHRTIYENQQTWDFAHRVCGKLWSRAGAVMLPLSLLAMLPALGRGTEETGMWCIPVTGVQLAVLVGSMFPVERALKENFDQFGRKR